MRMALLAINPRRPMQIKLPESPEPYRVILADPPWSFRDKGTRMAPEYEGKQREVAHYKTEPLGWIKALADSIDSVVAPDALLFMWAPHAFVIDGSAAAVAEEWGFAPKQEIVWLKVSKNGAPRMGGGHYTRLCTEPMILCRRGKATVKRRDVRNVIVAPRSEHSRKPDQQYDMIESLIDGPYLELFARRKRDGWQSWGDEV